MSLKDKIKAQVAAFDAWARPWALQSKWHGWAYEFLLFGLRQAWACLFGGLMLALLVGTHLFWPDDAPVARYDFLVVASVAIQAVLLATKLERWEEAIVIAVFHVVGTIMEIFKTAHGSWIYPEASILRIAGVPLFSGFMYACVGSYIARAMRLFEIKFIAYPPLWTTWALALLAYINFFTHHYIIDIRLGLFAFSALIFWRTWISFTADQKPRHMPMLIGLLLVSLFIWFAENLGTFAAAWVYPSQQSGWRLVPIEKMGAWYLLMLLSFVLVTLVHKPERADAPSATPARTEAVPQSGMTRWIIHGALIVTLTILTQVGGLIYVAALWIRPRLPHTKTRVGFAALFLALYIVTWAPIAWLASATGRAPLPCVARDNLSASAFSCVLHRHYADPALIQITSNLARTMDDRFPGTITRALDANFPFFDGVALPPHLSHDDGEKLDLAFYYDRNGEYEAGALGSPIGYWKFKRPRDGEPQACTGSPRGLRWDMAWFAPLTRRDLTLDEPRTRFALRWLAAQPGIGKIFVEPHLAQRLSVSASAIRFQGCYAARHDDHMHIQLR